MRLVKQKAKEGLQVSLNWTSGGSSWICNKKWKNVIKMVGSGTVQCRQQRRVWRIGLYTWYHLRNHQHQTQTPSGQQLTRELLGLPNDWFQNSTLSQHHRSSKFLMRSCEQKSWKDPSNPNDRRGDSDCETSIDCKEEWWVFFFWRWKGRWVTWLFSSFSLPGLSLHSDCSDLYTLARWMNQEWVQVPIGPNSDRGDSELVDGTRW